MFERMGGVWARALTLVSVAMLTGCGSGEETSGSSFTGSPTSATMTAPNTSDATTGVATTGTAPTTSSTSAGSGTSGSATVDPSSSSSSSSSSSGPGTSSTGEVCPPGSEGCPCNGDACDGELVCEGGVCVVSVPGCGNGKVDALEECDDGNDIETDACLSTCVAAKCGDGQVQARVEACDDGNMVGGDGCTAACLSECGNDCWGNTGCKTNGGRCIRFTCTPGNSSKTACDTCFGWKPVSYDQWLNQGYCADVTTKYRSIHNNETRCGQAPVCCSTPGACGGGDNAWHFNDGANNYFVGPCLGCANDMNCTYWNNVDNGTYTRITACERK